MYVPNLYLKQSLHVLKKSIFKMFSVYFICDVAMHIHCTFKKSKIAVLPMPHFCQAFQTLTDRYLINIE